MQHVGYIYNVAVIFVSSAHVSAKLKGAPFSVVVVGIAVIVLGI